MPSRAVIAKPPVLQPNIAARFAVSVPRLNKIPDARLVRELCDASANCIRLFADVWTSKLALGTTPTPSPEALRVIPSALAAENDRLFADPRYTPFAGMVAPVTFKPAAPSAPVMVAEARVAEGEQARMLLMLIRLVFPDAGGVSDTSTIGIMSLAGSAAVNAVSAVIFESAISVNG